MGDAKRAPQDFQAALQSRVGAGQPVVLEAGGALGGGYYLGGGGVGGKTADKGAVFTVSNGQLPGERGSGGSFGILGQTFMDEEPKGALLNNFTTENKQENAGTGGDSITSTL